MSALSETPKESFRLRMLLYDTRYRAITIQIVALMGFMLFAAWLINNMLTNLAELGKPLGFGFLTETSGYDINQSLIEYTSQSSHLRAAFIGLMNTLIVAVLGCALATVVGLLIGILRLSKNWIVARLMTIWIEGFRNVPVLLWIVFFMAVLIETLPAPSAFRGDDPDATMNLFGSIAVTNRGVYIPEPLFASGLGDIPVLGGLFYVSADLIVLLLSLFAGLLVSGLIRNRADRIQEATGDRPRTWHWRILSVFAPPLIVLWMLGFHLGYPELKGFNFGGGIHMRNSLIALWLALGLYTSAFVAEIVRAGIESVSKGQTEAAFALGLRPNRTMNLVILPQALRVIIPPLISQYLNITKNSSLAIAVGFPDLVSVWMNTSLNQSGQAISIVAMTMAFYCAASLSVSALLNAYNRRVMLKER